MSVAAPPLRRPELRRRVRLFAIAALARLAEDVAAGQEVAFALDEARGAGGPALYNYRPLYGAYVQERQRDLAALPDHRPAVAALRDDQVLVAYARERRPGSGVDEAIASAVLLPLIAEIAEGCGGFDFDDEVLEHALQRLEETAASGRRAYAAFTPLLGLRAAEDEVELGRGVVARRVDATSIAQLWPESQGLLPPGFGSDQGALVLAIDEVLDRFERDLPDPVRLLGTAVLALRLVLGGGVAAGPCVFERLEWSPRAARLLPPFAASVPRVNGARLDRTAASLARALAERVGQLEEGGWSAPAAALARYAVATGERSAAARISALLAAIEPLLGADSAGSWAVAMRAAALAGGTASERERIADGLRRATALSRPGTFVEDGAASDLAALVDDVVRATLVAALTDASNAANLAEMLDGVLLGSRPRPQAVQGLARSA